MKDINYLIVHKDHSFDIRGVNAGAEMATRFLARYLVEQGKRVIVAAQIADELEGTIDGVEYWDLGARYDVRGVLQRAREEGAYHLISSGRSQAIFESEGDPLCKSRMLICHDRSANDTGINPVVLCQHLDQVICVSEAQRQVYLDAGAPPEKVTTIKNGVDHAIFQEGQPEGRNFRRLVFAGALVQDKGVHFLIHAFCALKQKYPDLLLDVYGSADLWGRDRYIDPEDLQKRIPDLTFHGKQPQTVISEAFRTAGICVVPSIWFDPFPLTSIEAQTTGCPVVTFDVGGLKEGVIQDETGVVLTEVTEDALTRALDQLLSNPERLKEMSRNALAQQRPYYNWERVAKSVIDLAERFAHPREEKQQKIGFFTTWNQSCGLATYAKYLVSELPQDSFAIFAEDTPEANRELDESFVYRCWKKGSDSWQSFEQALQAAQVEVLHLNIHNTEEFSRASFIDALARFRSRGGKVIVQLHSIFTHRESAKALFDVADEVLVHSPEVRLEVISHGVSGEKVSAIAHGVDVKPILSEQQRAELRAELGMHVDEKAIVSFGFVQPHKGIEGMIEGVAALRSQGIAAKGYVVGKPNEADPSALEYQTKLKELAQRIGLENEIVFLDRFVSQDEVTRYLQAADAVVMNYRSQHYEASGACSLAVGAGAMVLTSLAPPFQAFGDAVWHVTSGFDISSSLSLLLSTPELQAALKENVTRYCRENSWSAIAAKLTQIYQKHHATISYTSEMRADESTKVKTMKSTNGMRVLIQNRGNMLTQRGGDTVVIEKLREGLNSRGIESVLDLEMKEDPRNYDIVHLINFAMPAFLEQAGRRAKDAGTPFVVTTLCEDIPTFHNQSLQAASTLVGYVEGGQDRNWYAQHWVNPTSVPGCEPFQNGWVSQNAACLFANGENEKQVIASTYAGCAPIEVIPVGYDFGQSATPDLFVSEYGVKDFVFCVGRFESRKNQLMLMKAMEDLEMPVVLASGGFSYQPQYDQAIRNFKRKGQTIILERVSAEMLASAYAAAKVHALPSWYELPGLVSMEAAYHGCNVVAADNGTAKNYLGDFAFYCQPGDESSLHNAILAAYYSPARPGFKEHVAQFTWEKATERTVSLYEQVVGRSATTSVAPAVEVAASESMSPRVQDDSEFTELLEQGENAAREREFEKAIQLLDQADAVCPNHPRVYRARGAVAMAAENGTLAEQYFQKAYELDPEDSRILAGLGMSFMMRSGHAEAYDLFVRALERDPYQIVAILQLLDCSYVLGRFHDLERVLTVYLEKNPENLDMQFCHAGCLFRLEKWSEAKSVVEAIQAQDSTHQGAAELLLKIEEEIAKQPQPSMSVESRTAEESINSAIDDLLTRRKGATSSSPAPQLQPVEEKSGGLHADIVTEAIDQVVAQRARPFDSMDAKLVELEEMKRRRDYQALLEACDEVLASGSCVNGQFEKASILRAEALALTDHMEEAIGIFEQYVDSGNPRAICGIGAIAASRDEWQHARACFEQALSIDPEYDVALAGIGVCETQETKYDSAWTYFRKALETNPENTRALLGTVQLGYHLHKLDEVRESLESYLELHPADLDFVYSLAGCLFAQGKLEEARHEVDKITIFQPDNENAKELQKLIQEKMYEGTSQPQTP